MGIREIRRNIGTCVDEAHYTKTPTIITKNDKPLAFIGPYEWLAERDELAAYRTKYGPLVAD